MGFNLQKVYNKGFSPPIASNGSIVLQKKVRKFKSLGKSHSVHAHFWLSEFCENQGISYDLQVIHVYTRNIGFLASGIK